MVTILVSRLESPLSLAWAHTQTFWLQTGAAIGQHPLALMVCATLPAAERGYVLLRGRNLGSGRLALLEALVTVWRFLLCAVAVWAACSGRQWRALQMEVGGAAAWQVALDRLGLHIAHHLRMVLWELVFLAVAMLLAVTMVRWGMRALAVGIQWLRETAHQTAARSVVWNLLLLPAVVVYLVEMARPAFQ